MQRVANDVVGLLGGLGDPAADLARMVADLAHERHDRQRVVAWLLAHHAVIERTPIDPRRRAGLEPVDRERALAQTRGQRGGRRVAQAPGRVLGVADMDLAGQNVPAVSTTDGASKRSPVWVMTPRTLSASQVPLWMIRSSTAAWNTVSFG